MTLLTPELLDTKSYGFEKLRYMLQSLALQEGVVDAADLKVVQRALGANMSVDVGAGRGFILGDAGTRNGLYHLVNDAMINVAVTAANATNPRIDQVILEIHDSSDLGSADDTPQLYVLAGTPTAGATLDNRNGVAALPANAIRLADILVPAASSSVVTANIRDRRQWARGGYKRILRTSNAAAGNDYTTSSTTFVAVDGTNLVSRMECSGVPVRAHFGCQVANDNASATVNMAMRMDDAALDGEAARTMITAAAGQQVPNDLIHDTIPAAGSHTFKPQFASSAGHVARIYARANITLVFSVEEIVRQNVDNI